LNKEPNKNLKVKMIKHADKIINIKHEIFVNHALFTCLQFSG